ncbi:MAG: hypothetical protein DRI23_02935 [Candidatus Cloacimonadota bacterium]|nr:MAG: hypothetical protein DRI23_02935 [Candidatus Cloacimonadota bacterium]RLC53961.1 MAG: hypothetical protein DRH79_02080 [Candidatus Cloacimonadota bacterium]
MLKFRNALVLITVLIVIMIAFTACGRKGNEYPNQLPTIAITSYEGSAVADTTTSILFQQDIYWEANDLDGTVDKYAFRVVKENLEPFTDNHGAYVGVNGYSVVDEDGWVYHYNEGADESIPLAISTQKSIWTDQVYATINFPANENGDSAKVVSVFEVKCKDNDGDECLVPARKYYNAESTIPRCTAGSTRGAINGKEVGTGMVLSFNINDDDPFVGAIADHFEFRLEKRNLLGVVIPEEEGGYPAYDPTDPDAWFSTIDEPKINEYLITLDDFNGTRAALKINTFLGGEPQDSTYLISRTIDIAGIISEPNEIGFAVKEGFYPATVIYNGIQQDSYGTSNDIYVLGENHFVTYIDEALGQLLPSVSTLDGTHYATPFWLNKEAKYVAIHSNDLKVYMHWGYAGEFAGNSPGAKLNGIVFDEVTGGNYYSEIKFYDLRLDGEPYHYAPLPASQYNIEDDVTGKQWLRVPISHNISTEAVLTGLDVGIHRFEVRAVDLQDVVDATPTEFVFEVVAPIPADQKDGILVLDDDLGNPLMSPEEYVDSLYSKAYFLNGYDGRVDLLKRKELIETVWISGLHFSKDVFSPTDLQEYKTVIYHSDNPLEANNNFASEYDVMNLYLRGGGNMIFSGGKNIAIKVDIDCNNYGFPILEKYFGITQNEDDAIQFVKKGDVDATFFDLSYFIGATARNSFTQNIDLQLPSFNALVNNVDGLGPVSYFDPDYLTEGTEIIYEFDCRPVGDGAGDPTQYEYDYFTSMAVGLKKVTDTSKCYIFGFPLSYMEWEQVNTMMMQIILDIEAE